MGSRAEHFRREFRGERRGCQSPAAAGDWLRRRVGSALPRHHCGCREAAQKWLSYLPLYHPRRLRRPDSSLHRMYVLVCQRPRCCRTSRGGTRDLRACAFMPKPSRITLRGCRSEDRRAVGQFSSNLLNGRFDHLRHAAQQDLGGSILARLIPPRGVATLGEMLRGGDGKRHLMWASNAMIEATRLSRRAFAIGTVWAACTGALPLSSHVACLARPLPPPSCRDGSRPFVAGCGNETRFWPQLASLSGDSEREFTSRAAPITSAGRFLPRRPLGPNPYKGGAEHDPP